jgi:hypothetical protein
MKTKSKILLFSLLIIALITNKAIGQSTQATNARNNAVWFLGWDGTGTAGAGALQIRNDFNSDINFFTNTTQKATILANGNVGIGTTTPTSLLHVVTSNALLTANHVASEIENNAQSVTGGLTNTGLRVTTNGGWIGTNVGLDVNVSNATTNFAALFNGGDVGIGTTTPVSVLHLNRNAAVGVVTQYTNPNALSINGTGFQVGINGAGTGIIQHQAPGRFIDVSTFGHLPLASFTTDNFFGSAGPPLNTQGDGLRIYDPFGGTGNLDLWTSTSNQTHIVWGPNGRIQGINNRFEIQCDFTDGLWFNVTDPTTGTFFNAQGVENGRIGANTFWRIGANPGNVDATNTLEIDEGTAGFSGLTFTQLTSTSTPTPTNPSGNVLTVDIDGKVILVPSNTGNVTACGVANTNVISMWTSGTTLCNSIITQNLANTRVGVGLSGAPGARLDVSNPNDPVGIQVVSNSSTNIMNVGAMGRAGQPGVATLANAGVIGSAPTIITMPTTLRDNIITGRRGNAGVVGWAQGSVFNYGGLFEATDCSPYTYGIYARGSTPKQCSSIGTHLAGLFMGDVIVTGTINPPSDITLKDSITDISNALTIIARLQPKQYSFKTDSFPYMNLPVGKHYGVIAQQIDTVLPELVSEFTVPEFFDTSGTRLMDSMTFKSVNYNDFIPLAIRGIQQLDTLLMQKTSTNITKADSNYVVKWNTTDKTLTKGSIYDRGTHIGIPAVDTTNYVTVANSARQVVLGISSGNATATNVVSASYSTNGNANQVAAVKGYSKYTNAGSADDGIGGLFEGGSTGVKGTGSGANSITIGVTGMASNATYFNAGVGGFATGNTSSANVGVVGDATNSTTGNVGLLGNAQFAGSSTQNTGINGHAGKSAYQNIGADVGTVDTAGTNYGIYSYVPGNAPKYYAGYFNGDVHATGTVTWASDARLKSDIKEVSTTDALALIQRLQPKSYTFDKNSYPYLTLPQGSQYGLLAQEVEQVLPQLVSTITHPETKDTEGNALSPRFEYKGVNYAGIIPLLVGAVKQQQTQIDSLENVISGKLAALEERMNGCCAQGSYKHDEGEEEGSINRVQVELSTMQVVVLEQNVPNPFAEQTSISYFIPAGTGKAQVVFSDILGSVIKTVDVEPGYGVMTVFGQSLSKGQYTYSLLIDGKLIETRKMTKTK